MTHFQVNDVDLEYVEEGSGVPVVLSHGGASDLRYWEPQREVLSAHYRFVAYSHRFHGMGVWPAEGDYSAEAHTADLVAIMHRLDAGPVHVVGFSTGIALRATLHGPGLVRTLTIVEPNVPWLLEGDADGEAVLAWWRDQNERVKGEAGGDIERHAKLWFELVNNRGPDTFAPQPEDSAAYGSTTFSAKRPVGRSPEPITREQLGAITAPTLLLGAEYGMPYSRWIVDRLARCIPGGRLVVVPGVTHFMSYQAPGMFNEGSGLS